MRKSVCNVFALIVLIEKTLEMASENKPIFRDLNPDDPDQEPTQIESLCMNCHANGTTQLLLTKIPFYKEVLIMSFACEECGYQNNEIQSGGQIAEKGIRFNLTVDDANDLNRQVVKSDYASIKIVELSFEIPSKSQKGNVTTVEGIIDRSVSGLEQDQAVRRTEHPDDAEKIDDIIAKLKKLKDLDNSFTLILEDISGNSHIENPNAPEKDSKCVIHHFIRTSDQDKELGIYTENRVDEENALLHPSPDGDFPLGNLEGEVLNFNTNCNNCGEACETKMKITNIPYFKEVVIMATLCESCGHRTNEVKSGGGVEPHGIHIEVDIHSKEDFSRDVLKAKTCSLSIPQLDLEVGGYTLSGRFTTVEGLLVAVKEQLCGPDLQNLFGDSYNPVKMKKLREFVKKLDDILEGRKVITIILDDPAGNSYIQSLNDDNTPDDSLRITHYERTFEQNEDLGLNDMKTENY